MIIRNKTTSVPIIQSFQNLLQLFSSNVSLIFPLSLEKKNLFPRIFMNLYKLKAYTEKETATSTALSGAVADGASVVVVVRACDEVDTFHSNPKTHTDTHHTIPHTQHNTHTHRGDLKLTWSVSFCRSYIYNRLKSSRSNEVRISKQSPIPVYATGLEYINDDDANWLQDKKIKKK